MADAWYSLQNALRALRKQEDIRSRLVEAYRYLNKVRQKNLPSEARMNHDWLQANLHPRSVESVLTEARTAVDRLSTAQLSEAVHYIVALHNALEKYQPPVLHTVQKRAACGMPNLGGKNKKAQLHLWDS